jgi:hypothetical protein
VCEESKTTEVKILRLQSQPDTFLDVKRAVEANFSIPACVQTLLHQSTKVSDCELLQSYYIRSGDTFQVVYPIEGNCKDVIRVVEWLKKLSSVFAMHSNVRKYSKDESFQIDAVGYNKYSALTSGENMDFIQDLALNLVYPWTDKTKYVNKLHMDSLNVVELVMHIYKSLVLARLNEISLRRGHYVEIACALFVANFTQTFPLRRQILKHGGLDHCIHTFVTNALSSANAIEVSLYAICKYVSYIDTTLHVQRS